MSNCMSLKRYIMSIALSCANFPHSSKRAFLQSGERMKTPPAMGAQSSTGIIWFLMKAGIISLSRLLLEV